MAGHTSEKRWRRNQNPIFGNAGVSELAQQLCAGMIAVLDNSRTAFLEMQELYNYAGGTVQLLADQLFKEDWEARADSQANAEELGKAQDLFDAITTLNELWGAANNLATSQEDRYAQLRRMS